MSDTVQEIAFRYAVDRVNLDRDILPRSRLTAQIERIPQQDSFYASKQGKSLVKYYTTIGTVIVILKWVQSSIKLTRNSTASNLVFEVCTYMQQVKKIRTLFVQSNDSLYND